MGKAPLIILALSLLAGLPGCTRQDTESLTKIGRKLVDRTQGVTNLVKEKLDWGGLRGGGGGSGSSDTTPIPTNNSLQEKVAARLRWDKNLEGVRIDVIVSDSNVELKGTVKNQDMRFRAVELTETTSGVARVTDSLTILDP